MSFCISIVGQSTILTDGSLKINMRFKNTLFWAWEYRLTSGEWNWQSNRFSGGQTCSLGQPILLSKEQSQRKVNERDTFDTTHFYLRHQCTSICYLYNIGISVLGKHSLKMNPLDKTQEIQSVIDKLDFIKIKIFSLPKTMSREWENKPRMGENIYKTQIW